MHHSDVSPFGHRVNYCVSYTFLWVDGHQLVSQPQVLEYGDGLL